MTVPAAYAPNTYAGNDLAYQFSFTFPILERTHLVVTRISATGVETPQVEGTNYNLTWIGAGRSGSISLGYFSGPTWTNLPVPTGETIRLSRLLAYTQPTDLTNNSRFQVEQVEVGLDRLEMQIQQLDAVDDALEAEIEAISAGYIPHAPTHLPNGTDPTAITNLRGLLSARPAASAANAGFRYTTTDVGNEFTALSDGTEWVKEPIHPVCETKTADFTAVAGVRYFIDASANTVTATLPASPALNDHVPLLTIDTTYAVSVARNGERLCGGTDDLTFDNAGDGVVLVFTPDGWWPEGELSRNSQPVPMTAADLPFAPTASITATDTQAAIEQADENAMVYAMIFGG
jgi:hypothetical protein